MQSVFYTVQVEAQIEEGDKTASRVIVHHSTLELDEIENFDQDVPIEAIDVAEQGNWPAWEHDN